MPFVSSYYRRSPGASAGGTESTRRLDVALYQADGTNLLRSAGAEWALSSLQFESGLPGGFLSASFRIDGPVTRAWPGRAQPTAGRW